MNLKLWRKILIAITFISAIVTSVFVTWKIVQKNNVEVEARTNNRMYKPIKINKDDMYKIVNLKNEQYVFNIDNAEYYLVHKTLGLYPELANKTFSFRTDHKEYPKILAMSVDTKKATKWIYSIIY